MFNVFFLKKFHLYQIKKLKLYLLMHSPLNRITLSQHKSDTNLININ